MHPRTLLAVTALGLSPLILLADAPGEHHPGQVPLAAPPVVPGDKCQDRSPADMRRNHMRYLMHKRDLTVHQGVRTPQDSLRECIACHVKADKNGQYPSIDSREHFCRACHAYAAVHIDCFECHNAQPDNTSAPVTLLSPVVTQPTVTDTAPAQPEVKSAQQPAADTPPPATVTTAPVSPAAPPATENSPAASTTAPASATSDANNQDAK